MVGLNCKKQKVTHLMLSVIQDLKKGANVLYPN